jgi:hypothetical protein
MKILHASNPIPAWQIERAAILHRACKRIQNALARGEKITRTLRRVARSDNGRIFQSVPNHQMRLSPLTLRRAWTVWKRGGEVPSSLYIKYNPFRSAIPAPILIRFAGFCTNRSRPSLKTAWQQFSARPGNFGRGRRVRQPLKISDCQLYRYFRSTDFYQMQSHLNAIKAEQMNLAQLRRKVTADIRSRLPGRLPVRRSAKSALKTK